MAAYEARPTGRAPYEVTLEGCGAYQKPRPGYSSLEWRMARSGSSMPGQTRTPSQSSLPGPTTAPSPMTESLTTAPVRTRAPRPTTESVTTAPGSTTASSHSTEPVTVAPAPITAPAHTDVPPCALASGDADDPGSARYSPVGPGSAGDSSRPSTRSREPCTKAAGVPTSSQ